MATFKINCPNGQQLSVEQKMMPLMYNLTNRDGQTCELAYSNKEDRWEFRKALPTAEAWQFQPDDIIEAINRHL